MLTRILGITLIAGAFISATAVASVKTSSLTVAKPTLSKTLPAECEKMFNTADKLVSDAEKQPGTHTQVSKMKNKLSSTKQQILKMDSALQLKSCEKGLTALNTLKQKHQ
ncbi:ABC transporter ATPase [Mannheimia granulomatis]|uniref:Membrane protein n=1 Tax=Mannheimia granulomatis TaxID=85402 RepID=A0A011MKJ6_9PAST|nr:DUF5339 domain-containing protein [Mannheimia granulomatis]EXI62986.1 membrane protein [Mannheimia granulomatis]QLB14423.1 ABC transporter ATPase [Mannheimia granulomatis]QLB19271.1 ABC transporter ATPase [Mannheimia granulomatis]RGE48792.1 ABC transporters ATPase [Mannheimia granulomatis]